MATKSDAAIRLEKTLAAAGRVEKALRTGEIERLYGREDFDQYSGHHRQWLLKALAELQEATAIALQVIIDMPDHQLPVIKPKNDLED